MVKVSEEQKRKSPLENFHMVSTLLICRAFHMCRNYNDLLGYYHPIPIWSYTSAQWNSKLFSICPHVSSLWVFQLAAKFLHQGDHSQGRPKWPLHASRPELSLLKPARPASIVVKSMHNRLSYDLLWHENCCIINSLGCSSNVLYN